MNDKDKRRAKRKAKKQVRGQLKPIGIRREVNVYDKAKAGITHSAVEREDKLLCLGMIAAIDETLDHFNIKPEDRSRVGDMLMRFSIMMAEQTEKVSFPTDSPDPAWEGIHRLADMYEHFNSRFEQKGTLTDQNES